MLSGPLHLAAFITALVTLSDMIIRLLKWLMKNGMHSVSNDFH
uniref:Uncharacterized protein n=1 Tax=Anguilla anguilla TaxID=7936 RepID=A0A0E9URF2_ANGAN